MGKGRKGKPDVRIGGYANVRKVKGYRDIGILGIGTDVRLPLEYRTREQGF